MLDSIPMAPALLLRWLVSFFNIEFDLKTRTLHLSLVKVNLGVNKHERVDADGADAVHSPGVHASGDGGGNLHVPAP